MVIAIDDKRVFILLLLVAGVLGWLVVTFYNQDSLVKNFPAITIYGFLLIISMIGVLSVRRWLQ